MNDGRLTPEVSAGLYGALPETAGSDADERLQKATHLLQTGSILVVPTATWSSFANFGLCFEFQAYLFRQLRRF